MLPDYIQQQINNAKIQIQKFPDLETQANLIQKIDQIAKLFDDKIKAYGGLIPINALNIIEKNINQYIAQFDHFLATPTKEILISINLNIEKTCAQKKISESLPSTVIQKSIPLDGKTPVEIPKTQSNYMVENAKNSILVQHDSDLKKLLIVSITQAIKAFKGYEFYRMTIARIFANDYEDQLNNAKRILTRLEEKNLNPKQALIALGNIGSWSSSSLFQRPSFNTILINCLLKNINQNQEINFEPIVEETFYCIKNQISSSNLSPEILFQETNDQSPFNLGYTT